MLGAWRKQRQWRISKGYVIAIVKRFYADRGSTRRDYTDPGFQEHGYINRGWFANTLPAKTDVIEKDFTHCPVYAGIYKDDDSFKLLQVKAKEKKERRMGEARRAYEESKEAKKKEAKDTLAFPTRHRAKVILVKKKARSRVIKDYSSYPYEGSGLDEYTKMVKAKEERKKMKELESSSHEQDE